MEVEMNSTIIICLILAINIFVLGFYCGRLNEIKHWEKRVNELAIRIEHIKGDNND